MCPPLLNLRNIFAYSRHPQFVASNCRTLSKKGRSSEHSVPAGRHISDFITCEPSHGRQARSDLVAMRNSPSLYLRRHHAMGEVPHDHRQTKMNRNCRDWPLDDRRWRSPKRCTKRNHRSGRGGFLRQKQTERKRSALCGQNRSSSRIQNRRCQETARHF